MKYNELNIVAHKTAKRVGRGISAGQGKTAGRGTKGQNARAGGGVRPGFEGGQNPLMRRLPKLRGFHSFKDKVEVVYTSQLEQIKGTVVDNFSLAEAGLVSQPYSRAKLILKGPVSKKYSVKLQSASQGAQDAVKKAGGSFTTTPRIKREAKAKEATK